MPIPRSGYTLPVFACAAAIAALHRLHDSTRSSVAVDLLEPAEITEISIEQVAELRQGMCLAITRSDPGDNLDLTRHTPIWAVVERGDAGQETAIALQGGEGVGRLSNGEPAIYAYARRLLQANLQPLLEADEKIRVTLILPEGRALAKRTSNEAFGVVEGLSLLGTTGIAQPLSAPGQLEIFRERLQQQAQQFDCLVFCVGENGLDLMQQMGIERDRLVKTANWLGSMLVEAGMQKVPSILLFGYHGKLLKLAGGIFHTHHYVADGRREILTAHCVQAGLPDADLHAVFACPTAEDGLNYLRSLDQANGTTWVHQVYTALAEEIDQRSQSYTYTHSAVEISVGTILFDRRRQIIVSSQTGATLLQHLSRV
jgi:cobalt-precorrin-5B (C1)-methyltransferase